MPLLILIADLIYLGIRIACEEYPKNTKVLSEDELESVMKQMTGKSHKEALKIWREHGNYNGW